MEINGLPAHVLVIHAAVIFLVLSPMVSFVYAVVPRWRWATRYPSLGLALIALGAVLAAYFTGRNLRQHFRDNDVQLPSDVALHAERASVLLWVTVVFVFFVLVAAWGLGGPSALVSGWGARQPQTRIIEVFLSFMVASLAVAVVAMTVATGDAGSQSVWHDTWNAIKG